MPRYAAAFLSLALAMSLNAQFYRTTQTVIDGVDVVQLQNPDGNERVSIAVSLGNLAYEFSVNGKNAFYAPVTTSTAKSIASTWRWVTCVPMAISSPSTAW